MKAKRVLLTAAIATMLAVPATAQAGPVDCVNEKFWGGRVAECPGDFNDCVNAYFWQGRILECV